MPPDDVGVPPATTPGATTTESESESADQQISDDSIVSAAGDSGYGAAAWEYRRQGWPRPIPILPPDETHDGKNPPPSGYTGHAGLEPSGADVQAWCEDRPNDNIAIVMHDGMIGVDIDDYGKKTGGDTIAAAEQRWGPLPPGPRSTSRPDDPISGIRFFRVPEGATFVTVIEPGGVEIIQPHHRYAVVWPSIHHEGRPYGWRDGDTVIGIPPAADMPWLPVAWVQGLYRPPSFVAGDDFGLVDVEESFTAGEPDERVTRALGEALGKLSGAPGTRFDATLRATLGLMRHGRNGHPGVKAALRQLGEAYVNAVADDRRGGASVAVKEYWRFLHSPGVRRLLAQPSYREQEAEFLKAFVPLGGDHAMQSAQSESAGSPSGNGSQPKPKPIPVAEALATFKHWLHLDDTAPVLATAATIVANIVEGDPVWTLIVGPPSSGKTEILSSCIGLPYNIVPAATFTEASLLSGSARKDRTKDSTGGLMRQIGQFGILLAKDFTTVLSQNRDTARQAMGALREISDGRWDRPVGVDGARVLHWEGKCGFIGGVTPSYDRYGSIVTTLGDRFLLLRLPDVDPTSQAASALRQAEHETEMRVALAEAMGGLIAGADPELVHAELSDEEVAWLIRLASFAARARTCVERDGYTQELLVLPQAEGPARLVKAMRRLYGALGALGVDNPTRYALMHRVARDCAPAIRVPPARMLLHQVTSQTTSQVAMATGMASKTTGRVLDDLTLLHIVDKTKGGPFENSPDLWTATKWLAQHWPPEPEPQP